MAYEPLGTIALTQEEQDAAATFIRDLAAQGQELAARADIAEELKRALCATAMLGLADRLTTEGRVRNDSAAVERGRTTAVKAFALYPIAVNVYECARILACSGSANQARDLFSDFLQRCDAEPHGLVRDRITSQHDIPHLISGAKLFLTTGIAPVT